jgi:hypothetical protein
MMGPICVGDDQRVSVSRVLHTSNPSALSTPAAPRAASIEALRAERPPGGVSEGDT